MVFSRVSWPQSWSSNEIFSLLVMVELLSTLNFKLTLYQMLDTKLRRIYKYSLYLDIVFISEIHE